MERRGYCDECQNTGYVECYCGGDLCVCENNGEIECPNCDGFGGNDDDEFDDELLPLAGGSQAPRAPGASAGHQHDGDQKPERDIPADVSD